MYAQFVETQDPNIDSFLGEKRHSHEVQPAQQIATTIMAHSIEETYRENGVAIGDAHPKVHGCVKALFHVDDTIAGSLAKGVFQPGHT